MRTVGWRCVQVLCLLAIVSPCMWTFIGIGRPPYGGRVHYNLLFVPLGWNGAGPPRPIITRNGDQLGFSGYKGADEADSLAIVASDPRPYAWGLFCPITYTYWYGVIRWDEKAFPIRERERLRTEIDRVRRELATSLATERASWYRVPPGYFEKYAAGEGSTVIASPSGIVVHLVWVGVGAIALLATLRARQATRALREHDRLAAPRCPKCGYDLSGLSSNACPECGTSAQRHSTPSPRTDGL